MAIRTDDVDVITVYLRIQKAKKTGSGIRLSWRECVAIMCDGAVQQALDTAKYEEGVE